MTPQLQTAIAAIERLNSSERQHLLEILLSNETSFLSAVGNLKIQSEEFWNGVSLEHLRAEQNPKVYEPENMESDFWPQDENIDDFLAFLYEQRHEVG